DRALFSGEQLQRLRALEMEAPTLYGMPANPEHGSASTASSAVQAEVQRQLQEFMQHHRGETAELRQQVERLKQERQELQSYHKEIGRCTRNYHKEIGRCTLSYHKEIGRCTLSYHKEIGKVEKPVTLVQMVKTRSREVQLKQMEKKDVPEVVKPGISSLPMLDSPGKESSPVDIQDWLEEVGSIMGDLSDTSHEWWRAVRETADGHYKKWVTATPMEKLTIALPKDVKLEHGKYGRVNS
ncbi:tilS, partial [Symbiodinium sp. KB8]